MNDAPDAVALAPPRRPSAKERWAVLSDLLSLATLISPRPLDCIEWAFHNMRVKSASDENIAEMFPQK